MVQLRIGVLGLQGAIEDHEIRLSQAAVEMSIDLEILRVTLPEDLSDVDGLVMPGGESTAMTLIGKKNGMLEAVRTKLKDGLPAFGTCAGAILLSKTVRRTPDSPSKEGAFPILDMEIFRNGYGRQRDSFTTELKIEGVEDSLHAIFIRAPVFAPVESDSIEVLAEVEGDPVFVKQGHIFATTFHPELSPSTVIHQMFLEDILGKKRG